MHASAETPCLHPPLLHARASMLPPRAAYAASARSATYILCERAAPLEVRAKRTAGTQVSELRHVLHYRLPLMLATSVKANTSVMVFGFYSKWSLRRAVSSSNILLFVLAGATRLRSNPYVAPPTTFRNMDTCFSSATSLAVKYSSTHSR